MHLCENCHQFVSDEAQYCANCGVQQKQSSSAPPSSNSLPQSPIYPRTSATLPPPYPTINRPGTFQQESQYSIKKTRNRGVAAALNFFIPGAGYIYNGIGRDKTQLVFGIIILIAVFVGFYIPIIGSLIALPANSAAASGPAVQALEILLFILPIGLAYDAYHRAG